MTLNFCKFQSLHVFILHVNIGPHCSNLELNWYTTVFGVRWFRYPVSPKSFCKVDIKQLGHICIFIRIFLSYTFHEKFCGFLVFKLCFSLTSVYFDDLEQVASRRKEKMFLFFWSKLRVILTLISLVLMYFCSLFMECGDALENTASVPQWLGMGRVAGAAQRPGPFPSDTQPEWMREV